MKVLPRKISTRIFTVTAFFFTVAGLLIVFLVNGHMRRQALLEAESKARILLDANLATHTYFSHQLKPTLFKITDDISPKGYFDPVWMSSTYAIREITKYRKALSNDDVYYKECAINARSPENEADPMEVEFIEALNRDPDLEVQSDVRTMNGIPYFVVLRRGEVMETACLRCHSSPGEAPEDLVKQYGSSRSFRRSAGDVVSAISIRIPLASAYGNANRFSAALSILLLAVLLGLYLLTWLINRNMLFNPLKAIQEKVNGMIGNPNLLGERIPEPHGRELKDLSASFNTLSADLRKEREQLEEKVEDRTVKLKRVNRELSHEVEERRHAEAALTFERDQLLSIFDNMNVLIFVLDPASYEILFMNRYGKTLFQRDPTGERCYAVLHGRPTPCEFCNNELLLGHEDSPVSWEYHSATLQKDFLTTDQIIKWPDGRNVKIEASLDITEQKRLQAQLLQTGKMDAISTLTGGIAHDYNNLLAVIMGNLSLAMDEAAESENTLELLDEAEKAALKAKALTHQLMALSRGGYPLKEAASVEQLLRGIPEQIGTQPKIEYVFNIQEGLWPLKFDARQMQHALGNVVTNAAEAMPEGGTITLGAENRFVAEVPNDALPSSRKRRYVRIFVKDSGIGIGEEHLQEIFDPYFSTKERGVQKGMGLGLTISYAIIRRHGGRITVRSIKGAGTTAMIDLPVSDGEADDQWEGAVDAPAAALTAEDNTKAGRILVMDDDPGMRGMVAKMLHKLGYEATTVKDGSDAIDTYRKHMDAGKPFDALILDLTVREGMGGEQAMKGLLEINPHVKAIVSSGYFNDPVMAEFQRYGFKGALAKPFKMKTLTEALEKI